MGASVALAASRDTGVWHSSLRQDMEQLRIGEATSMSTGKDAIEWDVLVDTAAARFMTAFHVAAFLLSPLAPLFHPAGASTVRLSPLAAEFQPNAASLP